MNNLTVQQNKLPATLEQFQKQFEKQTGQMEYIAMLATRAMDEGSNVIGYSMWKTAMTLATAEQLKQAFAESGLSPEAEAVLQALTQDYMAFMRRVPQAACILFLRELERIPSTPENRSLLEGLRRMLPGQ
jgi:hypothetical protein